MDGSRGAGPSRRGATGRRAHRCVLVSTLGTLLEAGSPEELARQGAKAAVRAGAAVALKACARSGASLFLMTQCLDEASEAWVVAVLEACGLLGLSGRGAGAASGAGGSAAGGGEVGEDAAACAVPRHRALFCSTLPGKVAMARQLEADLYVDCDVATLEELRRFNVKVLCIERCDGRGAPAGAGSPSGKAPAGSLRAPSLEAYFLPPPR